MVKQKVAIVGSGISGLTTAYLLNNKYDVTVYEASHEIGGHTATVEVSDREGMQHNIDTGFIIFNNKTYPNFSRLMNRLEVERLPIDMDFSVYNNDTGYEYMPFTANTYFAQRENLFSRRHWKLLHEILSFNKSIDTNYKSGLLDDFCTVSEYVSQYGYTDNVLENFIIPSSAAIWSLDHTSILQMPIKFYAQFFVNHGLLSTETALQWYTVKSGARSYHVPLTAAFKNNIITDTPIERVVRLDNQVAIHMVGNTIPQFFDHVVLATHSPEALTLLQDSTDIEKEILGAIRYQSTAIVVHTDDSILPKNKLCKVSWNCATNNKHQQMCTYNSNMLHGLHSSVNFWVTVNPNISIDESKIIQRKVFAHPLVTRDSIQAQKRKSEINGYNRVWFAGAYWGNGFHEDGVVSAIDIAKGLGVDTAALL